MVAHDWLKEILCRKSVNLCSVHIRDWEANLLRKKWVQIWADIYQVSESSLWIIGASVKKKEISHLQCKDFLCWTSSLKVEANILIMLMLSCWVLTTLQIQCVNTTGYFQCFVLCHCFFLVALCSLRFLRNQTQSLILFLSALFQ